MKKEYLIKTRFGDFRVKIWFDQGDKAYLVKGVTLPKVVTFGRTLKRAKEMAKEALELYCQTLIDQGHVIIDTRRRVTSRVSKSHTIQFA